MQAGSALGRFIGPGADAHVDLTLNVRSFFHRKGRGMTVTDQDGRFEEPHHIGRGDASFNFTTTDQRRRVNCPLMTACSPTILPDFISGQLIKPC